MENFQSDRQNRKWISNKIFDFQNIRPFSPGGFFTFLVAVAHGAALSKDDFGRRRLWTGQEHLKRRCLATLPGPLNTVQGVPKKTKGEGRSCCPSFCWAKTSTVSAI